MALKSLDIEDYCTLQGQPLGILEPSHWVRSQGINFAQVDVDLNPIDTDTPLDLRVKVSLPIFIAT